MAGRGGEKQVELRKAELRDRARPPRVVLLALYFPPEYSGAGVQTQRLLRALARLGVPVRVLTAASGRGDSDPASRAEPFTVRRFLAPRGSAVKTSRLVRVRELVLGLRAAIHLSTRSDWDLLHLLDVSYFSLLPIAVARLRSRPVVVKTTLLRPAGVGLAGRSLSWARRRGYESASAIVALSEEIAHRLRSDYRLRGPVLRIPNGVDVERFRPPRGDERRRARERYGLSEKAFVVATCGTLVGRKNPVDLVRAAARMGTRPLEVVLAGPPSPNEADREELRRALAEVPEGVRIHPTGKIEADDVPEILRAADAYALPSKREGLPNSLLEGMAAGLACVATDIPGSRDVLRHGGGELVPLGEPAALAHALDRLAEDPERRERLGREAVDVVQTYYSLQAVAERYLRAYRSLTGRDPSDAPLC